MISKNNKTLFERRARRPRPYETSSVVEASGTEYPIDVDPSTVELPEEIEDALM